MAGRLFPELRKPWVFAHRGYSAAKPENTLAAFDAARSCGAHGIELDIQMCSTGEVLVFHDWTVERMTDGSGTVTEMSWRELAGLKIGEGERIPLLKEVFDLLGRDMYYDIEIKTRGRQPSGIEQALSSMIETRNLSERVMVSSFNPYPLREFRRISRTVPTSVIYTNRSSDLPWYLRHGLGRRIAGANGLKPDHRQVNGLNMRLRRLTGRSVLPWTVDDPQEALRLIRLGCDGVITNEPEKTLKAIREEF